MSRFCFNFLGFALLLLLSNGFLLQQNTTTSSSSFVSRSELYEVKQSLQHSLNDLRNIVNDVRTDAENDLKILASQLQQDLNNLNSKVKAMNQRQRNNSACIDLEMKHRQLEDKYAKLSADFLAFEEKVAVSVCVTSGYYSYPSKVNFTIIRSQTGPIDTDSLKNGDFKCLSAGLYLVSATLVSRTTEAQFYIYKNDLQVVHHYISSNDHADSGTSVVALELNVNDTVSVKPATRDVYFWTSGSCLTVIKIK